MKPYPTFREFITQTPTEVVSIAILNHECCAVVIKQNQKLGDMFIRWKCGKAEEHYRKGMHDKHSRRYERRYRRKLKYEL